MNKESVVELLKEANGAHCLISLPYLVKPKYYSIDNFGSILKNLEYYYPNNKKVKEGLKGFHSGEIIRYENNQELFESFKKENCSLENFWVQKRHGEGYFNWEDHLDVEKFSDSYLQLVLGKENKEGAIASFEPLKNSLLITQIQGFNDGKEIWSSINYPKFFISFLEKFARENEISEIFVLPHFRNKYIEVRENKHGQNRKYDVPAKQMGFELDFERGVYFKKLN